MSSTIRFYFARAVLVVAFLVTATEARAVLPTTPYGVNAYGAMSALDTRYQIGDEWGKVAVTSRMLADGTEAFRRAAFATATAGGATSFYLGKFNGRHVMATNHHVFKRASACLRSTIRFPLLGREFKCVKFFGSWSEVDLALFEIEVRTPSDEEALSAVGRNFAFHSEPYAGQPLITIGFGVADNPNRVLVANQDSDCKVFSERGDYRFMADPDDFNPADYRAWSFSNGCDVSHGDSGSAMVDRNTGDVVGLIWTGKIPKASKIRSSSYLNEMLRIGSPEIWTELSYAVPSVKIADHLATIAANPSTPPEVARTLEALLSTP